MKNSILLSIFALCLAAVSCDRNDESGNGTFTSSEARVNAELDLVSDDLTSIVEDAYRTQTAAQGRYSQITQGTLQSWLPSCATTVTTTTETTWTTTITFSENCTLNNGNTVSGQITVTGSTDFSTPTYVLDYTLSDFYHNNRQVAGNRHVTFTYGSSSAQPEVHPIAEIDIDYTVTDTNGTVYTRSGHRTREMISGYGTWYWADNVYLIAGSWNTVFPSGTLTSTIGNPLLIEMTCPYVVSGTLLLTKNGNTAEVDYGSGTCDNSATVSINDGAPVSFFFGN